MCSYSEGGSGIGSDSDSLVSEGQLYRSKEEREQDYPWLPDGRAERTAAAVAAAAQVGTSVPNFPRVLYLRNTSDTFRVPQGHWTWI